MPWVSSSRHRRPLQLDPLPDVSAASIITAAIALTAVAVLSDEADNWPTQYPSGLRRSSSSLRNLSRTQRARSARPARSAGPGGGVTGLVDVMRGGHWEKRLETLIYACCDCIVA